MADISLEQVTKVYPTGLTAVSDLSLDVADGEFMVLVGPSGCGKTTALRMVAGLESISSGILRVGGRVVNDLSPKDRDVAMVFQNYALYPHMTVSENIGFALRLRKQSKEEVRTKVEAAARILGLTEHLNRKPSQLSGGQRQRVAMGRAIVREPSVFLMDEPLSNLDAKLRVQMRSEISRVQRRLGVATLYVTHDQTEAMTMGDRVAVLRGGVLQQCDRPQVLYDRPTNLFVAAFIGSPAMSLYEAVLSEDGTRVRLGEQALDLPAALTGTAPGLAALRGRPVVVGIRPEHLADEELSGPAREGTRLIGDVELVEALGSEQLVHFRLDAPRVRVGEADVDPEEATEPAAAEIGGASDGVARVDPRSKIKAGTRARFVVDVERLHLFDPDSGAALRGAEPPAG